MTAAISSPYSEISDLQSGSGWEASGFPERRRQTLAYGFKVGHLNYTLSESKPNTVHFHRSAGSSLGQLQENILYLHQINLNGSDPSRLHQQGNRLYGVTEEGSRGPSYLPRRSNRCFLVEHHGSLLASFNLRHIVGELILWTTANGHEAVVSSVR